MRFHNNLNNVLNESVVTPTRVKLCPQIFDDDDEIKPEVLDYVKKIVNQVDEIVPVVGRVLIKGSILSYQWLPTSDFDILVEIDEDITDEQYEVIKEEIWDKFNDGQHRIPGTKHQIEVFPHRGQYDVDNADGVYDVYKGWIKGPYDLEADLDTYMNDFRKAVDELDLESAELMRNVLDHKMLKSLPEDSVRHLKAMVRQELEEIEHGIRVLAVKKSILKDKRREIFDRDMTPEEIKRYGSKNLLPDNVVLKMLERYHYIDIINQLEELLDDGKISDAEVGEIADIFKFEDDEEDIEAKSQ